MRGFLWAIAHAALDTLSYLDLNLPTEVQLIEPKNYAKVAANMFREFEEGW
ncbi:jg20577, partial [Pararge aegeria aegeria]